MRSIPAAFFEKVIWKGAMVGSSEPSCAATSGAAVPAGRRAMRPDGAVIAGASIEGCVEAGAVAAVVAGGVVAAVVAGVVAGVVVGVVGPRVSKMPTATTNDTRPTVMR